MSLRRNWWIFLLLAIATTHCAQSIFFDNYSYLDLVKYENGQEKMPFQARVAMVPLLHWAHSSALLGHYGKSLEEPTGNTHIIIEPFTAEKLVSYWAGLASLLLIVGICSWYGYRHWPRVWWVCPSLALAIFYASYAARVGANNMWYPYDLPHAALLTLACVALLEGSWSVVFLAFLVDLPVRETSIFLIPLVLAVGYVRHKLPAAIRLSALMMVLWAAVFVLLHHHYHGNPSQTGVHYKQNYHLLGQPRRWPQVLSVYGFLWLPILLNLRLLTRAQKALLVGIAPGLALSVLMGIWYETRAYGEWNGIVACLAFWAFCTYLWPRVEDREEALPPRALA